MRSKVFEKTTKRLHLMVFFFLILTCWSTVSHGGAKSPGSILWDYLVTGTAFEGVVASSGNVYFGTATGILAVDKLGQVRWTFETGSEVSGIPVIDETNGYVHFFSGFELFSLTLDGDLRFRKELPFAGACSKNVYWAASVALGVDGSIYVPVRPGIAAFSPDGELKWTFRQSADSWYYFYSPVVDDQGVIYAFSSDGCLYAIHSDGTQKWVKQVGEEGTTMGMAAIGAENEVYYLHDNTLFAVNRSGAALWQREFNYISWDASPTVGNDGMIYVPAGVDGLYAVTPENGIHWIGSFPEGNGDLLEGMPGVTGNGSVIVSGQNGIHAFDNQGRATWSLPLGYGNKSLHPFTGSDDTMYFSGIIDNTSSRIYAYSTLGTEKWTYSPTGVRIYNPLTLHPSGDIWIFPEIYGALTVLDGQGKEKWIQKTAGVDAPVMRGDGKAILGQSWWDENLVALSATGTKKVLLPGESGFYYKPALDSKGNAYLYFYGGEVGAKNSILKVDPCGGRKWELTDLFPNDPGAGGGEVIPTLGQDDTVYISSLDTLYAYNPNGSKKWSVSLGAGLLQWPVVLGKDDLIIVNNVYEEQGRYVLRIKTYSPQGQKQWDYSIPLGQYIFFGGWTKTAVGTDGILYVVSQGDVEKAALFALNGETGTLLWELEGQFSGTPVIGNDGVIYTVSTQGIVHAINETGDLLWQVPLDQEVNVAPIMGEDGTLYIGTNSGKVLAMATGATGPADSPWPMYRHDAGHTGSTAIDRSVECSSDILSLIIPVLTSKAATQ